MSYVKLRRNGLHPGTPVVEVAEQDARCGRGVRGGVHKRPALTSDGPDSPSAPERAGRPSTGYQDEDPPTRKPASENRSRPRARHRRPCCAETGTNPPRQSSQAVTARTIGKIHLQS
jgi:hypothetical protein